MKCIPHPFLCDNFAIIRKVVNLTFLPRKKSESFIVNIFTFSEL